MIKWIIFLICFSMGAATAGTKQWQEDMRKLQSKQRKALVNDRPKHEWSTDGKFLYAQWIDATGKKQWYSYSLSTGERRLCVAAPKTGSASRRVTDLKHKLINEKPRHRVSQSPNKKWSLGIKNSQLTLNGKAINFPLPADSKWIRFFDWAPDSSAVVVWHRTTYPIRQVHYIRSSPTKQLQPEHFSIGYPKPGDKLNISRPVVIFTDGRVAMPLSDALCKNLYGISNVQWAGDSSRVRFDFVQRGYQKFSVLEMNVKARTQREFVAEKSNTFVYVKGNTYHRPLTNDKETLWFSQITGFNQLYLLNNKTGRAIRPLTKSPGIVRKVVQLDEKNRTVLIERSGCFPGQNPYYRHYARVNLDTGKLTSLTDSDGSYVLYISPNGKHYLAGWSRVDHPPVYEIRRMSDGKKIATLPAVDTSRLLNTGWQMPERFVSKDRNGKFDIHGIILRPPHFDASKKYPVIERIYSGPHSSFTPTEWTTWYRSCSELTAAGFIVVQVDGLGTCYRGKEFHDFAYKNLMDGGLPDRISWMKAAAKKHPEMDLTRVGIYGGSAGGQNSLAALLNHGDFYKAAASDCGCHDNRMDKIWWNEQWMGWPVDESYARNSNVTHAHKLKGALMLTVGEIDVNVDPSSTYQVVKALIKADKDFEFYPIPNGGHSVGETPYLRRKRLEFFKKHLME